jgi:flagellar protein FliJ
MAESRAKRIQVVLTLARQQEDIAAKRLGQYREQLTAEEQQLSQLKEYATQYMRDYAGQRQGVYAHQLINYSGFVHRLGELCKEQEIKLERMQVAYKKLQEQWRTAHQKRKSVEDLIERFKQEESLLLDKQLQKELDELSTQKFARQENNN